jgi:hypothetical protein
MYREQAVRLLFKIDLFIATVEMYNIKTGLCHHQISDVPFDL